MSDGARRAAAADLGRRFLATGLVATAADLGGFVFLAARGTSPAAADVAALNAATAVSWVGHRRLAVGTDPGRAWYQDAVGYLLSAISAGSLDVAVLQVLLGSKRPTIGRLVAAKTVSMSAAGALRLLFFRRSMFDAVRGDQEEPLDRPPPPGELRLSLVIPAFQEEAGIGETIAKVEAALGHLRSDGGFELIVVDDGSADGTAEAARRAGADVVVELRPNRGKGGAVRAGMLAARGRCVAFTDADLSYSPDQVLVLLEQVEAGWDAVVGSRQHDETHTLVANRRLREVGGRIINLLTSVVLLGRYRDTQCGLKGMRSDVARVVFERTRIDGFAFDIEVLHLVERYRFTLLEVPVRLENSSRSTVKVARDATRLVRDLFRIRSFGQLGGYDLDPATLPTSLGDLAETVREPRAGRERSRRSGNVLRSPS
jgi:putative flippase GtrA